MTSVGQPQISSRGEQSYLGIRIQTPMKGMFAEVDKLRKELARWLADQAVDTGGAPFLRYHVIDMKGEMDVEYGIPINSQALAKADKRVKVGLLPAGRYAHLTYVGHGLTGNKALLKFVQDNQLQLDRWTTEKGDAFASRLETYLTDPKVQPLKSRWEVEVAMKLKDESL